MRENVCCAFHFAFHKKLITDPDNVASVWKLVVRDSGWFDKFTGNVFLLILTQDFLFLGEVAICTVWTIFYSSFV